MIKAKESTPFQPICELAFFSTQSGEKVIVRLGAPVFDESASCYFCWSEIEGLKDGYQKKDYGDTQFEALTLSLHRFHILFARLKEEHRTEHGNTARVYFPKEIPWVYGSDVYERLCKMVDDEVQKIEDDLTRRREAWERSRGE